MTGGSGSVKHRFRCAECGTSVASLNETKGKWSVWVATLDREEPVSESEGNSERTMKGWEWAKPTDHIFYGTRMLDVNDGLRKWEGYAHESEEIL